MAKKKEQPKQLALLPKPEPKPEPEVIRRIQMTSKFVLRK